MFKNVLAETGYSTVALPRAGITPLQLLVKDKKTLISLEGSIDLLFEADIAPKPILDNVVASFNGQKALELDTTAGLNFLSGIFEALKIQGASLKADATFDKAHKFTFSFVDVREDKVNLLDLDNFISGAIPSKDGFNTYMEKLLDSDLYVISHVLKCKTFAIDITDENNQKIDAEAAFSKLGEGTFKIERNVDNGFHLIPDASGLEMVFGFKAQRIIYDKPKWFEFWKKEEAKFKIEAQEGMILRGLKNNEPEFFGTDPLPPEPEPVNI